MKKDNVIIQKRKALNDKQGKIWISCRYYTRTEHCRDYDRNTKRAYW